MSKTARQDQGSVTLTVDDRKIPIVFKKRDGGATDSEESKSFPGGMSKQKAHGGPQTVDNVTLTFEFIPEVHDSILRWMRTRAGGGDALAIEQNLDRNGNAFGKPTRYTGVLKKVDTGNYDAASSDPREGSLEISTDGAG